MKYHERSQGTQGDPFIAGEVEWARQAAILLIEK